VKSPDFVNCEFESYNLDGMPTLMKTGTVDFDNEIDPSLLPAHLGGCLRSVDADEVRVKDECVTFRGGIFRFVTNWNVLVAFGFGDLTVDSESRKVRYCLSYRQLIIFTAIMAAVTAATILILGNLQGMSLSLLTVLPLSFIVVFVNLAWRTYDFKRFLRRSIATAPHKAVRNPAL
jgi:hypothetical protein